MGFSGCIPELRSEADVPQERFFSQRLGRSRKVSSLNDFQYRVWTLREIFADDYGVSPYSAISMQADATVLKSQPQEAITAALDQAASVGLLIAFEYQGELYLCNPRWQEFQNVRWPRKTIYPCPPRGLWPQLERSTLELFREHHPMFRELARASASIRKNSRRTSEQLPLRARARVAIATATAKSSGEGSGEGVRAPHPIREFLDRYVERFKARFGEEPVVQGGKDAATVKRLLAKYGHEKLVLYLDRFFTSEDPFIARSGYTIGVFSSVLNKLITDGAGPNPRRISEGWRGKPTGQVKL